MNVLPQNRNAVWDRVLVDTLLACGVRRFILCPGGRNGLLAMTIHRSPEAQTIFHIDERSAAFVALGLILADGQPTAVCTTSGSAAVNLLPATAEAAARALPLVLLTCDRPVGGRLPCEPQTVAQAALCAPVARSQLLLPDPLDGTMDLAGLSDAVAAALDDGCWANPPGPVHLNIPQWGDYCATEEDPCDSAALEPRASVITRPAVATIADVERVAAQCDVGQHVRGLVLAGHDQPLPVTIIRDFLEATGFPIIADVCSGLRYHDLPTMMTTADALAEAGVLDTKGIDCLIRLGGAPVSPGLTRAFKRFEGPTISIGHNHPGPDFLTPKAVGLLPLDSPAMAVLAERLGQAPAEWRSGWAAAELLADSARSIATDALEWGEIAAASQVFRTRGFGSLHCANSLSVRYAGLLLAQRQGPLRTFTARGTNGTDGTLGLLLGEAMGCQAPMLALLGDQAFVHDLAALSNPHWRQLRGAICVMNNAGGGIFDLTAARRVADYGATMRNPPAIDFSGIAQAFGFAHRRCGDRETLAAALVEALQVGAPVLVEIIVPPLTPLRDLPMLVTAMGRSALAATSLNA